MKCVYCSGCTAPIANALRSEADPRDNFKRLVCWEQEMSTEREINIPHPPLSLIGQTHGGWLSTTRLSMTGGGGNRLNPLPPPRPLTGHWPKIQSKHQVEVIQCVFWGTVPKGMADHLVVGAQGGNWTSRRAKKKHKFHIDLKCHI